MEEDLEHIDLIDKYLSGTLSAVEKDKVEELLRNDADFAKELQVYKQLYRGIKQNGKTALKQPLGD